MYKQILAILLTPLENGDRLKKGLGARPFSAAFSRLQAIHTVPPF